MPREYQYPFELRHLVYFREVARQLHFRKAAESLAVAQPALSRSISQLEKEMGVDLLNRTRRRVALAAVPADIQAMAGGQAGHVRVAFTGLAMATVLPGILREFNRRYPGIRVELNESPTSAQLDSLKNGEIACGFFHPDGGPPAELSTKLLLQEKNGVLLPAEHPRAKNKKLRLRDLADTPFVMFPRAHNPGFYDRVLAAFQQAGVTPRIADEVWPRANAIGLVRAGLGATFMAPSEARQLPDEVAFRPIDGPAPESRLVLGWRKDAPRDPALGAFLVVAGAGT